MSASIYGKIVYSWLDIYPCCKVIHKHNYYEMLFDWHNNLVLLKIGIEIKTIEIKSDIIL